MAQNECFFDRKSNDTVCLGPITEAGCKARCPSNGVACDGCRGFTSDPHIKQEFMEIKNRGLSNSEILRLLRRFSGGNKEQTLILEEMVN